MPDLNKSMEALRATRDLDTCLQGLKHLRSALRGENGLAFLESIVHMSPDLAELHAIWDSQLAMKDDRVAVTLLLVLISILTLPPASAAIPSAAGRAADALAASVVAKRMKALYFLLGSDHKGRVNASLALMTALVRRGVARDLVRAFDFDVPAFGRAARAPRQGKGQEEGGFPRANMHVLWTCDEISKRVTRSLFVDFGLALLGACDAALLSVILPIRPLFGGLLLHLHQHPPHIGTLILQAVHDKVLNASNAVPPRLKAEPFGDAVLTQLANLAALDGGEPGTEELAEEASSILRTLGTDPSVGLCPARGSDSEAGGGASDPQAHSGRRRLMRLLFGLKPTKSPRHFQLLTAVTEGSPEVAAAYIAGTNLNLEPKLDTQWLAGMALVAQVTEHAMRLPLPFLGIAQRRGGPPTMDSGVVRGLLRRMLPTCMSKMHLSRGLQHISALVRYVTLCTLRRLLSGVASALADLSAAAALASSTKTTPQSIAWEKHVRLGETRALSGSTTREHAAAAGMDELLDDASEVNRSAAVGASESAGTSWRGFARNLRNAVRARVPDVKALQNLLTALETKMATPAIDMDANEQAAKEVAALCQELGEPVRGTLSGAEISLATLLGVLAAYQHCIPEAAADARFDPARLLAKDVASWPPLLQHNLLELLTAATGSSGTHCSPSLYSPASLQALLKLAGPAAVPENARLAQQLLTVALSEAVGFEEDRDEVLLWLHMLPSRHSDAEEDRPSQAVAAFLVEAVTSVARRPHEMYELAVEHCSGPDSNSKLALHMPFSLLAVAALTRAFRVVRSEKMPSASRAAIAGYVASVLAALISIQRDPTPLCYLISGLAFHAASAAADKANAQTASAESELAGIKRWWDRSMSESSLKLRLPMEGTTLISLEAFARMATAQRAGRAGTPALKKRKLGATGGSIANEDVDLVMVADYDLDNDDKEEGNAFLEQIRGPNEFQAYLLTQSARDVEANLPHLASICIGALNGEFGPLLTALRAHPIHICASYPMLAAAAETGETADADLRTKRDLLRACPFLILAHAACCTPGLMDPATYIGQCLLQTLSRVPSEGQAVVLRGLCFWARQLKFEQDMIFACDLVHIGLKASCTSSDGLPSQEAVEAFFHFIAYQRHSYAWTRGAVIILEWLLPRVHAVQQNCKDAQLAARAQAMTKAAEPFLQMLGAGCLNILSGCVLDDLWGDPLKAPEACGKLASYLPLTLLQQLLNSFLIAWQGKRPVDLPGEAFASVSKEWADVLAQLVQAGIERRADDGWLVRALAAIIMSGKAEVEGLLYTIDGASDLILQLGEDALHLLKWCIRERSTAAVQLAARLNPSIPVCALRFSASLPSILHEAGASSAMRRREAIAALLPAAKVYLQQLLLTRKWGAIVIEQASSSAHDAVATALRDPLVAYLSRKGQKGEAELSASAVDSLANNAAEVLKLCIHHHPLAPDQAQKFFQRIAPTGGWLSAPAKAAAVQGALSRASVAAHMLQSGKDSNIRAGSSEGGDQDAYDKALVRYAIACLATLEVILKLPAGSARQACTELQRQLLHDLDTFVGDAIAESHAVKQAPDLSTSLASATQSFAAAAFQHQLREAGIVRSLRRFLAALLPTEEADKEPIGDDAPGITAKSASLAALAQSVTGLLLGNSRFEAIVSSAGESALPAGISNLITPMSSMLTLADASANPVEEHADQVLKKEVLELLETLLDLRAQHSDSAIEDASVTLKLQRLLPLLLGSYDATLSATDRAALRVLLLLDSMMNQAGVTRRGQEEPGEDTGFFLAQAGYLWGEAAMKANLEGALLLPQRSDPSDLLADRQQLLAALDWVDQRRCALTVCHFPESRTLTADEAEEAEGANPPKALAEDIYDGADTPSSHGLQDFGYDPAFLLRFCVQALREGSVGLESFAKKGLLALCLRCLACEDVGLRGLAYEAVALYSAQLGAASFRDKQQLSALLKVLQLTVSVPFQRLPALIAVFLAEAATVLQHPQSTLYSQVNKLLTRRPRLKLEEVPLMAQLWMSGVEDTQAEERAWLLRLLTAGLQGPSDGDIFRKRFVGEVLMSLHGSPLSDTQLNSLALLTLCKLPSAPAYAGDLVLRAGLIPWLSVVANTALHSYATDLDLSRSSKHRRTAVAAAQLLLRLLHVRNWAKQGALMGPLADFGLAALSICQSLAGSETFAKAPQKMLPTDTWSSMLRFVAEVLRLSSRPAHQPGSLVRLRNGVLSLSDIGSLLHPVEALIRAGEESAERLRQQLLDTLALVEVFPASSADQQSFTPVSQWAISTAAALPAIHTSTQPSAAAATLAWISAAVAQGAVLHPATPKDRVALARKVLALQATTRATERRACARPTAVVTLHLMQPLIAAELGVGKPSLCGWLADSGGGSREGGEQRPAADERDDHPPGSPGGRADWEEAEKPGSEVGTAEDGINASSGGASDGKVEHFPTRNDDLTAVQPQGGPRVTELAQTWKYLLGNTLLRLLDELGLPRFGGRGSGWPVHSCAGPRATPLSSISAAEKQDAIDGGMAVGDAQGRVAELVLLMLRELLAGLWPDLTMLTLRDWAAGSEDVRGVGQTEVRCANLAGIFVGET